jgi:hypothetical protein
MNSKPRSKITSLAKSFKEIPAAYDIDSSLSECRKKGLKARLAIAWMEGGRVQVSLDEEFLRQRIARNMRGEIYNKWHAELKFTLEYPDQYQLPDVTVNGPRLARCVAVSSGQAWSAWKEMDVCHFLLNPPGTPLEKGFSIIPQEYTIFDPNKSEALWMVKPETGSRQCCSEFGWSLLSDIARVYCLAVEFIDEFEQEFEFDDESRHWTAKHLPAALLRDCQKATRKLIVSMALMREKNPKQSPDAGVALQQGFLIGKKLAQAEGIISNARETAWLGTMGKGRAKSKFWKWINSDPIFKGKSASEALGILNGKNDPDFPGKLLKVTDKGLVRGNKALLRTSSFTAKYKSR